MDTCARVGVVAGTEYRLSVSRNMAMVPAVATNMRQKAGTLADPVALNNQVTTNGAKPPNNITAKLYAIPVAVERTPVGNCSARVLDSGP